MKSYLPFLTFAILLTSCSSVYKSGQTPDDVYFSPERPRDEYARVERKDDRMYRSSDDRSYRNDEVALEDRYLRMKVRNRRYGLLDDYDCYCGYGSNYYSYNNYYRANRYWFDDMWWTRSYDLGFYYRPNYYSSYYYNPYYKNPYYNGVVYGNVNPVYNKPRTTNLRVFDGSGSTYNPNTSKGNGRVYSNTSGDDGNYRGSGTNAGGFLRNVFGSGSNSSNSGTSNTAPSSSNNSGSSSGSSSSGSSHAPVRKF